MPTKKERNKRLLTYLIGAALVIGFFAFLNYLGEKNTGGDGIAGRILSGEATELQPEDWVKGNRNANVTLIEYGDFQCPACGAFAPIVKQLEEEYGDRVRFVYRHFPLTQIHPLAIPAARATEAAGKQDKFWEMHDILFEKQTEWSRSHSGADNFFVTYAEEIGLDLDQFGTDYRSSESRNRVQAHLATANELNLSSTPSFLLNGRLIQAPNSYAAFASILEAAIDNAPLPEVDKDDLANAKDVHEHADFAVYLNGSKFDFSLDKYQSDEPVEEDEDHSHDEDDHHALDPYVHLHNGNGEIIHKHKEGVTLSYFFNTLGMEYTDECFITDNEERFCNDSSNSLKFFVNGKRQQNGPNYVFNDLDRILISYGPLTSRLESELESVKDEACIYSEKCPERGEAPVEKCVGGLGSNCSQ